MVKHKKRQFNCTWNRPCRADHVEQPELGFNLAITESQIDHGCFRWHFGSRMFFCVEGEATEAGERSWDSQETCAEFKPLQYTLEFMTKLSEWISFLTPKTSATSNRIEFSHLPRLQAKIAKGHERFLWHFNDYPFDYPLHPQIPPTSASTRSTVLSPQTRPFVSVDLVSPRFVSFCLASSFDRIDQELPALETKLTELRQKKAWNHEADRSWSKLWIRGSIMIHRGWAQGKTEHVPTFWIKLIKNPMSELTFSSINRFINDII